MKKPTPEILAAQAAEINARILELIGESYRAGYRDGWAASCEDRRTNVITQLAKVDRP